MFFGSALTNFGVRKLLDAVVDLFPSPTPRPDVDGVPRPLDAPFSGFVFKVQANMDPSHRDRIAFLRVCSGRFERGMVVTHEPTGKPFATKYAHQVFGQERETIDEAFPGDVIGLVNATDVQGRRHAVHRRAGRRSPASRASPPSTSASIRVRDTGRFKQFRRGIAQLDEEGVVQVLRDADLGDQAPVLAAVGPMQFEVAVHRLENEFGAPVELSPTSYTLARRTDEAGAEAAPRHAGCAGDEPGRRHAPGPVREPVLGAAARAGAARPDARTAGGGRKRRLSDTPGEPHPGAPVPNRPTRLTWPNPRT